MVHFGDDIAHAPRSTATARIFPEVFQVILVVESEFLPCPDVALGYDPKMPFDKLGFAVRSATVVEPLGRIPFHVSVQIVLDVQAEDERIIQLALPQRFLFVDNPPDILDNPSARGNCRQGKSTPAVNR